jgi:BioD-like phosphotransacetylase family protein
MMGIGIDTSIASANEVQEAIAKQTSTTTSDTTAPENVMDKAVGYLKSATDKRKAFDQVIGKYGEQLTEKQVAGLKKFVR